jgi:hypothetical protein
MHYMPLSNAVNDARDLEKVLRERYNFQNVKAYYDETATQENIRGALEWYENNLKEDDKLIIFFSGHGYYEKELGYLVPVDAAKGSKKGFINNSTIKDAIRVIEARHVLLILDSCFGGSFGRTRDLIQNDVTAEKLDSKISRRFMSSGSIEKVSDGTLIAGNSPFTKSLLRGLQDNTQPQLIVSRLFNIVQSNTAWEAEQIPQYETIVGVGHDGGEMVLRLNETFLPHVKRLTISEIFEIVQRHIHRKELGEATDVLKDYFENNTISLDLKNKLFLNAGAYNSALDALKFGIIGYADYEKHCFEICGDVEEILFELLSDEDLADIDNSEVNPKKEFVEEIEVLIHEKNVENALILLVDYYKVKENFDEDLISVTMMLSQISEIKDKVLIGKAQYQFYQQLVNRITKNLHELLDDILERDDEKRLVLINPHIEKIFTGIAENEIFLNINILRILLDRLPKEVKNEDWIIQLKEIGYEINRLEDDFQNNKIQLESYFVSRNQIIKYILNIANFYAYSTYSFEMLPDEDDV